MRQFNEVGKVQFDKITHDKIKKGFVSASFNDQDTLQTIGSVFSEEEYLLDPHGAVAVTAAMYFEKDIEERVICLTTAHPAKFPQIIEKAIGVEKPLPKQAYCHSIEVAKKLPEKVYRLSCKNLFVELKETMLLRSSLNVL